MTLAPPPLRSIKGPVQVCSRSSPLPHRTHMGHFLGVVRVLFLCLFVAGIAAQKSCQEPKVRREWRKLSPDERAEWIGAVNVLIS